LVDSIDSVAPVELVTVHVFGVPGRRIPSALGRMALDHRAVRRVPGLAFARLLGTGNGTSFTIGSSDFRHWAIVASWRSTAAADDFEQSPVVRSWDRIAQERLRVRLAPLTSRGRWGGREPFGSPPPRRVDGPVASITRARIAVTKLPTFWRAVPPVAEDLPRVDGVRLAIGLGEAPIGFQGTFSIWSSAQAVTEFAHRRAAHQLAVRRTSEERWYAEELFARFEVLGIDGTYAGRTP